MRHRIEGMPHSIDRMPRWIEGPPHCIERVFHRIDWMLRTFERMLRFIDEICYRVDGMPHPIGLFGRAVAPELRGSGFYRNLPKPMLFRILSFSCGSGLADGNQVGKKCRMSND